MNTIYCVLAASMLTVVTFGANEKRLHGPQHGNSLNLAEHLVSVVYTEKGSKYEVVTTVGANARHDYVMRFVAELGDGEQLSISVGNYGGRDVEGTLTLRRVGDKILAAMVPQAIVPSAVHDRPSASSQHGA